MVTDCLRRVMERHGLDRSARIVVFGAGLIGGALIERLQADGHNVAGIDKTPRHAGIHPLSEAGVVLGDADVVVLLTARGSDFAPYVSRLKDGAVILDDTHPAFPRARLAASGGESSVTYYKATATRPGLRIVPALPGYGADWLPGCALEGIVLAEARIDGLPASQEEFDVAAERLGFRGLLAG